MPKFVDLTGQKFNKLKVLQREVNVYRTYISPTLLNAYTNGYDWISMIKREPIEENQAMKNGVIFEEEVYKGTISEASAYIYGSVYQPCLYGEFDKYFLFGYADFMLPNEIIDTKFKSHYDFPSYYNSNQHLIYTYLTDIEEFTYLIGIGSNPKKPNSICYEKYNRNDKLLLSRLRNFDRAIDKFDLRQIYNQNYNIERVKEKIEKENETW